MDEEDFERVSRIGWRAHVRIGTLKTRAIVTSASRPYTRQMSRFIMDVSDPNLHVHHINGNPVDNRKSNLMVMGPTEHRKLHRTRGKVEVTR